MPVLKKVCSCLQMSRYVCLMAPECFGIPAWAVEPKYQTTSQVQVGCFQEAINPSSDLFVEIKALQPFYEIQETLRLAVVFDGHFCPVGSLWWGIRERKKRVLCLWFKIVVLILHHSFMNHTQWACGIRWNNNNFASLFISFLRWSHVFFLKVWFRFLKHKKLILNISHPFFLIPRIKLAHIGAVHAWAHTQSSSPQRL